MRKRKPSLIVRTLVKEDTRALRQFFVRYPYVGLRVEDNRIVFKALGVTHFHELEVGPSGVREVEA